MLYRRILILFLLFPAWLQAQHQEHIQVLKGRLTVTTTPLRNWQPDPNDPSLSVPTRDQRGLIFARDLQPLILSNYGSRHHGEDPLLQKRYGKAADPGFSNQAYGRASSSSGTILERDGGTVGSNINGIPYSNLSPADPTLAVGPNHIIQMVNGPGGSAQFIVYNKSGAALTPLAFFDQLPGTTFNGAGDCITWYDQLSDRFVMSEFGDSAETGGSVNTLILAVSKTNDPTGSWYVYEFSDAGFFPDYPKYGNWTDAWYGVTRDFIGNYVGNSVWAFNKAKMIAGDPAPELQRVRLTDLDSKFNTLCPVSMAGTTPPPAGAPGMFMYYSDNDYTSSPTDADSIGMVSFHVDFSDASKSVVKVEKNFLVAPFKSNVCDSRNCAPSPSGAGYDVLSTRVMNKPWYRNFGTHEDIVLNHTVDADGNNLSALRWYQLRKTGATWGLGQQGTFSPQEDNSCNTNTPIHRFMGSIGMNGAGQVALAYNSSGLTRNASISFTGRNEGDPVNLMTYAETDAVLGKAYGTFSNRWGDYSDLQPDVTDDSLFWFTAMYGESETKWGTRIISFRLRPNLNLDARLVSIDQPNDCNNPCSLNVRPVVTIRNLGNNTLHDLDVFLSVNGGAASSSHWTGNLAISTESAYTLPLISLPPGTDTLKIWVANPNGSVDQNRSNDTLSVSFTVGANSPLPLQEGFEGLLFPPTAWSMVGNGTATYHWNRSTAAAHSGSASIWVNNYQTNEPGRYTDLRTPVLDIGTADSADLSFYYAAGLVSPDNQDTLEVLISSDCGKTYQSVWKKWGADLQTRNGYVANSYLPTFSEWRKTVIDLTPYRAAGKVTIAIRNINGFGNNIWLDDINVETVSLPGKDAAALALVSPTDIICTNDLTPSLRIVNLGKDTLRSLDIRYTVDGGQPLAMHWTGTLPRLEGTTVTLPISVLSGPGAHDLVLMTSLPNGQPDELPANDTVKARIYVQTERPLPDTEGFEGSFPPLGWASVHDPRIVGWRSYNGVSPAGGLSVYIRNYRDTAANAKASLITPIYTYQQADSVFFDFYLAAATYSYPGSTDIPLDTLEVSISTDCGQSYTSVYKKWGAELQTLNEPNLPHASTYFPGPGEPWRLEHIDLTAALAGSKSFLARIQCTSNHENNLFIDQVRAFTRNLPERLKKDGYLLNPNPVQDKISLRVYPDGAKFRGWELFSSSGQLLKKAEYGTGNAPAAQEIRMSELPAGIYSIRLRFQDRTVTEKIVKL